MTPIKNVPIATCATAYDHAGLQETVILVFHETLYFGSAMEHSLLNPNQIRANGLIVDTCPRQYDQSERYHYVVIDVWLHFISADTTANGIIIKNLSIY